WIAATRRLAAAVATVCGTRPYRCFFGVDAEGLIAATRAARGRRIPVVYHSLEMELLGGETRLLWQSLRHGDSPVWVVLRRFAKRRVSALLKKPLERSAHQRAAFTLSLDEVRAKALLTDNELPSAEVIILPTSPLALRRRPDRGYLRRKFGLDERQRILLQIGGISDVSRSLELAPAAQHWPDDWTLILHGFSGDPAYLERLRPVATGRRVILSTSLVPYSELDDLVASADVGLALFRGIDLNYVHMASGKLLQYLKCGVPVIASDFPNLRRILHDNSCGLCVSDENAVQAAAARILADPEVWAANATRCFQKQYDFAAHFARVLARIEKL